MAETPAKMYALATILTFLASVAVALRLKARSLRKADLAWDDYAVCIALVFTFGTAICMIIGTAFGDLGRHTKIGRHGMPIMDRRVQIFQQVSYASNLTVTLALGFTKISVLFLYKRIFRGTAQARLFVGTVWTLILLVAIWTIAFFFANMLQCLPISVNWTGAGGSRDACIDENMMYIGQATSDAIVDFLILLLPIPCIWNLQLPTKQKVAVCCMFLLGALTIASSVAKLVVFFNVIYESTTGGDVDFSYLFTPTIYWPMIESSLGIVGACLPLLKPIVSELAFFKSMFSTASSTKGSSQNALRGMEEGLSQSSLQVSNKSFPSAAGSSTTINGPS